jgi:hypothetical protein
MTDQLREVLTRVADRSGPVSVDPLLWAKASRTRRRRQRLTAAAAVLVVVVLLGGIALATSVLRPAPAPVDLPDGHESLKIDGISGDGGLRAEKDLAIGRASMAIANETGAFLVTAEDGVTHRIALPGFDAPRYAQTAADAGVDFGEVLSLSPDGTKLIYAWHEPFVPPPTRCGSRSVCGKPGKGWVRSGSRLVDLTTGTIATYPPAGAHQLGVSTQLGQLNWNFRWSPDSRFVAFDEGVTSPVGWPIGEDWGGLLLDTSKKVRSPQWLAGESTNPRVVRLHENGDGTVPIAVNDAGLAAWVVTPASPRGRPLYREQSVVTSTNPRRPHPLPDNIIWRTGRFSPDGRFLLVEPAGLTDQVLAIDLGRVDRDRPLQLEGDLPSNQVRIELLGWVGANQAMAAVHRATGDQSWQPNADLARLTINLQARTADLDNVGEVGAGDTGSAFDYATDVLAADIPSDEPGQQTLGRPSPAQDTKGSSTVNSAEPFEHIWLVIGVTILILGGVMAVMVRRKRT